MSAFKGTDFEIALPAEYSDESTYAFAFPTRGNFRPSLVVKSERLAEPSELSVYVEKQLEKLKQLLPSVTIISKAASKQGEAPAFTCVYDWGEATQRVRQKQRYLLLAHPWRVVTLTGTTSQQTFPEVEALFDAIFNSFKRLDAPRAEP